MACALCSRYNNTPKPGGCAAAWLNRSANADAISQELADMYASNDKYIEYRGPKNNMITFDLDILEKDVEDGKNYLNVWMDILMQEEVADYEMRAMQELGTEYARWPATGEDPGA